MWDAVEEADVVIHAGDWMDVATLDELDARSRRLVGVFGTTTVGAARPAARGGPRDDRVACGSRWCTRRAGKGREERCAAAYPDVDVLVFGHSHIPWDTVDRNGLRLLNPGSPTDRRRQPHCTYLTALAVEGRLDDVVLHRLPPRVATLPRVRAARGTLTDNRSMRETSVAKKKDTASKKKSTPTEKTLRAEVEKLQAAVRRAEKKADRWKAEARAATAASKKSDQKVAKLTKRLKKASSSSPVTPSSASGPAQVVQDASLTAATEPIRAAAPTASDHTGPTGAVGASAPDETWTVAALKNQARAQGLTGFSRMSKADLLAALG